MSTPVLKCVAVCKSYSAQYPILENFNISFDSGKIIGLLGPNGCGKTTLIKLVSGLLPIDSGEIYVCGQKRSEKTSALISYLPERTYFSPWMKVEELIGYFRDFYADFDEKAARRMLCDLHVDTKAKLRTLSKGTKEKVQLVLVMARKAKLYLLDEPIAGVDPAAREYILETVMKNYNPDATVIITTHLIHDIEPILDEFVFLSAKGKILLSGNTEEVKNEQGKTLDELFREVFRCSQNS